jgi:hypothetical protein
MATANATNLFDVSSYTDAELYRLMGFSTGATDARGKYGSAAVPTSAEITARLNQMIADYRRTIADTGAPAEVKTDASNLVAFLQNVYARFDTDAEVSAAAATAAADTAPLTAAATAAKRALTDLSPAAAAYYRSKLTSSNDYYGLAPAATLESKTKAVADAGQSGDYVAAEQAVPSTISAEGKTAFSAGLLNPIRRDTYSRVVSIESKFRNKALYPRSTDFTCNLSERLVNVVALQLYYYHVPYTWYTVSNAFGDDFFYIVGTSPGLDDTNHAIKVEITPGSYTIATLTAALNAAVTALSVSSNYTTSTYAKGAYADIDFAPSTTATNTVFTYDTSTVKTTLTLNMMQRFNEVYFYLDFPGLARTATAAVGLDGTLAELFRLDADGDGPWQFPVREARSAVGVYDTGTTTFAASSTNLSFTVYHYSSADVVKNTTTITLSTLTSGQSYTRTEWLAAANAAIAAVAAATTADPSNALSSVSGMELVSTSTTATTSTSTTGYYKLTASMNRKNSATVKGAGMYTTVVFPDDPVWIKQSTDNASCFRFAATTNTLRVIKSNERSVAKRSWLSYTIPQGAYIYLRCNRAYWSATGSVANDMYIPVAPTAAVTCADIDTLSTTLTATMATQLASAGYTSNTSLNSIIYATTSVGAAIDVVYDTSALTAYPRLSLDVSRTLSISNFSVDILGSTALSTAFFDADNLTASLSGTTSFTYSYNITSTVGSGTTVASQTLFTVQYSPPSGITSYITGLSTSTVYAIKSDATVRTWSASVGDWASTLTTTLQNLVIPTDLTNAGVVITGSVAASSGSTYVLTITMTCGVTETDYGVYFVCPTTAPADAAAALAAGFVSTSGATQWADYFGLGATQPASVAAYTTSATVNGATYTSGVAATASVAVAQIALTSSNNYFYIRASADALGLYTYTASSADTDTYYNDYKIALTLAVPGRYTYAAVAADINAVMATHSDLAGSAVAADTASSPHRTAFTVAVNKEFTQGDYKVVFYDMERFTKCAYTSESANSVFAAATGDTTSTGALNSSRYSTIGWTLGFREATEYTAFATTNYIVGETTYMSNAFNSLTLVITDYVQNTASQSVVTVQPQDTSIARPSYADYVDTVAACTINETGATTSSELVIRSRDATNPYLTHAQLVAANQVSSAATRTVTGRTNEAYSKDAFAIIPLSGLDSATTSSVFSDYGRSLQVQERVYFGPVNLIKLSLRLVTSNGDVLDLNNADWGVALIAKQLNGAPSAYDPGAS